MDVVLCNELYEHPEPGSFVDQIPAWDRLDQASSAGLSDPAIHWIAVPSYGVLGQELPARCLPAAG